VGAPHYGCSQKISNERSNSLESSRSLLLDELDALQQVEADFLDNRLYFTPSL
jgi:hypothetical protein